MPQKEFSLTHKTAWSVSLGAFMLKYVMALEKGGRRAQRHACDEVVGFAMCALSTEVKCQWLRTLAPASAGWCRCL